MNINISQMKQRYNTGCETGTADSDNANIHIAFFCFFLQFKKRRERSMKELKYIQSSCNY